MKKKWFFGDLDLPNSLLTVILSTLIVCIPGGVRADEVASDGGAAVPGVTVRIKPTDARRSQEISRLREEVALAEQAVKRLELENKSLREVETELRRELMELRDHFQKQNESYRLLQLWLAGVPEEGTVRKPGRREEQLYQAMGKISEDGGGLALKAVGFCEEVQQLMRELPIGKVRQVEIQLKLDDLARSARRFVTMTEPVQDAEKGSVPLRTCRILAVNRELSIVVLSVGSVQGAFAGLIYRVGKGAEEEQVRLKVVGVRPSVAAAVVVSGSVDSLAPGMEAVTGEKMESGIFGKDLPDSKLN